MMGKETNVDELEKVTTGKCNIIVVVKFFKPFCKTKGSGFSQFVSVTDPSLQGAKFPITLMQDDPSKFPPLKSPGDILVMHRLLVSSFRGRLQGVGYGSAGFAAAVFPGGLDAELKPYTSASTISYSDDDLKKVEALKVWYNSANCPVEKENFPKTVNDDIISFNISTSLETTAQTAGPSMSGLTSTDSKTFGISRLHSCQSGIFYDLEVQLLSVYEGAAERRAVVLYVWDGEPAWGLSSDCKLPFQFHRDGEFRLSRVDPVLAATTGHRVLQTSLNSSLDSTSAEDNNKSTPLDWSVPIFVFDEYISLTTNINPGDYLRLTNVHCLKKGQSMFQSDNSRTHNMTAPTNVRLLSMHGGGRKYGRNIEVIEANSLSTDLKCRLEFARNRRRSLATATDVSSNDLQPITIYQISQIPIRDAMPELNTSQSFLQGSPKKPWSEVFSFGQLLPYHTVRARICARVLQVYPQTEDQLRDCLMVVCSHCAVADRLSSLEEGGILNCDCRQNRRTSDSSAEHSISICPIFQILLADATGQLGAFLIGDRVEHLLGDDFLRSKLKCLISSHSDAARQILWNPLVDCILQGLSQYDSEWIDAVLMIGWKYRGNRDAACQNSPLAYFSDCHRWPLK